MPNAATSSAFVLTATKCCGTASSPRAATSQSRAVRALVSVSTVVNVFDDTMNSVSAGSMPVERAGDVGAVDVGHEAGRDLGVAEGVERPVRHRRAEVGAADADVDDRCGCAGRWRPSTCRRGPARRSRPSARAPRGRRATTSCAVDLDDRAGRRPQRDVQHGAVLGDVDPLAGEHRVAAGRHAGDVGDGQQGGQHVVVDALLGVVDAQVADVRSGSARPGRDRRRTARRRWGGCGVRRAGPPTAGVVVTSGPRFIGVDVRRRSDEADVDR